MAKGNDGVYDVRTMNDRELGELVRQKLREEPSLPAEGIEVFVRAGTVGVRGRLGTEGEVETVERILLDELGLENVENELVVDELVRQMQSEAADVAAAENSARGGSQTGERTDPEAAHLLEDVEGELYGTDDMRRAIEGGESYNG